jgi:hypothetical protein
MTHLLLPPPYNNTYLEDLEEYYCKTVKFAKEKEQQSGIIEIVSSSYCLDLTLIFLQYLLTQDKGR